MKRVIVALIVCFVTLGAWAYEAQLATNVIDGTTLIPMGAAAAIIVLLCGVLLKVGGEIQKFRFQLELLMTDRESRDKVIKEIQEKLSHLPCLTEECNPPWRRKGTHS